MTPEVECRCPPCRALFRGETLCPRCGADLSVFMRVNARAYNFCQRAQACFIQRDFFSALALARKAVRLHRTRAGIDLLARAENSTCSVASAFRSRIVLNSSIDVPPPRLL